uniref:PI-PLC X domain-containing protein 1 n=1 Tax=Cacopsylla melanoneura TaxID=428564 RepID=A0A8D8VUC5_9HEMI
MDAFKRDQKLAVWILIALITLAHNGLCEKQPADPLSDKPVAPSIEPLEMEPIFITISPLHRTIKHGSVIIEKEIQLNWNTAVTNETFDSVALYTVDPSVYNDAKPEVLIKIVDYPDGFYQTNVSISTATFPAGWENKSEVSMPESGEHCMPFWAGTLTNDVLQFLTCLKIRPTWMHDHRDVLGHLSLLSLLVPGTHNSACYKKIDLSNIADIITENTVTQDVDVWGQLVYGIRYISLQTSYYSSKKKRGPVDEMNFYINNDMIKLRPLLPVLADIRKFLEISQHEIVFLDFHRFPVGMKSLTHHKTLIDLIEKEFGDIAYPRPEYFLKVPTLDMVWKENKRLIIFYGEEARFSKVSDILWDSLHRFSGRKQTVTGLYHYIEDIMSRSEQITLTKGLWAIMAHLNPDPLAFFSHPELISLRSIAENSNRNISDWFVRYWWKNTSIISTDFFLNTNVINMAVNTNIYKGITIEKDLPTIQYNAQDKGMSIVEDGVSSGNKLY